MPPKRHRQSEYQKIRHKKDGKKNHGFQMDFPVASFGDIVFFEVAVHPRVKRPEEL